MPAPWQPWPEAAVADAASLAPPTGESARPEPEPDPIGDAHGEPEPEFAALPTAETEEGIPYASEAERVLEEAVAQAPVAHPAGDDSEPSPAPVRNEEVAPYAGETERVLEEAVARAPAAHPEADYGEPPPAAPSPPIEDDVLAVTEKPANPRPGWWQRLTQ